ncbi:hypothetical protein D3C86_1677840 [compost metagenome]
MRAINGAWTTPHLHQAVDVAEGYWDDRIKLVLAIARAKAEDAAYPDFVGIDMQRCSDVDEVPQRCCR